ncbi:MAG: ABC transporter substrate-binding protein [Acidobacteriota bacterium]|nr:ABC transporter substrate-binding protein [Acidobacteriota bacterium]
MRRALGLIPLLLVLSACPKDEVVRFSAVLPLSGMHEIYGQAVRKGVDLAYEELVADEEFPYQVELDTVDSAGDPSKGQELLTQAYNAGALAVIGGVTSAEAIQMVEAADRFDRVLISPSASTPQLTGISKNFYRVFPSDSREGTTMGNFASQKLQLPDVVILAKVDTYAKGIVEVFQAEFERNGGEVLDVIEYPPGAADFSGLTDRVKALDPAGVYVAAYAEDIGLIISELVDQGFEGKILTTAAFAAPTAIEQNAEAAEGVFITQAGFDLTSEDPKIVEFVEAFRNKYALSPDLYSAHGYDAVMVLAEALRAGGPAATDFWKSVRGLRDFVGVTGTIQFDERGDVQKFPRVYMVEDGNLIDYEREVEIRKEILLKRLRELEEKQRRRALQGNS